MPSRLIKILGLLAVTLTCVLIAIVLFKRPAHPPEPFAGTIDKADRITVKTGDSSVDLTRDSATWTVSGGSASPGYKADPDKVKSLLNALENVEVEDVISEHPGDAAEFELNPASATQIQLLSKSGTALAAGWFGKQAPDFTHLYFKYPDQPSVHLARGAIRGELGQAELRWWRDRTLFNFGENQVLNLLIEMPTHKTALARSSTTWTCNGRLIDPAPVWGIIGTLAHLRAEDFVDPSKDPGLTAASLTFATVHIQLPDTTAHTLHLGKLDPQTTRYPVSVDTDPSVGWVPEGTIKAILQKPGNFKPLSTSSPAAVSGGSK
jgi:hypothetical protein